jgi:hypothetical protein
VPHSAKYNPAERNAARITITAQWRRRLWGRLIVFQSTLRFRVPDPVCAGPDAHDRQFLPEE